MAERKAVNKYYPPDWDPRKGSANKRVGQHPLRDRARKLSQGILVIRFELPYNIWCGGCGNHVGMGVRYNAEKSKVGNYYSTPIYKFRMKCHLCDNYFEIQTDPKNHDYVILSGARRKEQRWDPVANEQLVPEDKATQKKLATDPMYKLEHGSNDQRKGKEKVMSLSQIEESRTSMLDDYILNRMARDKFRTEKKQMKEAADADRAILERASLSIDLVEESEEDRKLAGLMKYSVTSSFEEKQQERRKSIELRPIFSTGDAPLPTSSSLSSPPSLSHASQNQALPAVNQHGDSKNKLGRVLQTTFKDPFKIIRKKSGIITSSSSLPNRSRLGIRLKSSKNTTFGSPELLKERKTDKADGGIKSSQLEQATSGEEVCNSESRNSSNVTNSKSFTSDAISAVMDSGNTEKYHCNSINFTSELSDRSSEPICTKVDTLVSLESGPLTSGAESINCYNQVKDPLKSNGNQEQDNKDKVKEQTGIPAQATSSKFELNTGTTGDAQHNINTGLLALICNYTDSDSESSS